MTDHDDESDDPQLNSLRAVWLAMPDEDPPERGLADLMAAARVKAEEMARPSLWQRIAAMLRRPPVLALATVLVLVGGAVFIGQRHSKLEAPAPNVEAPAVESARIEPPRPAEIAAPESQPAPPEPARHKAAAPVRRPARDDTRPATKPADTMVNDKVEEKRSRAAEKPAAPAAEPKAGATRGMTMDLGREADSYAPEAAPAVDAPAAEAPVNATQHVQQAKAAAARGDCAGARTLMKRVASEDAAAYRKALASDAALKKCFE